MTDHPDVVKFEGETLGDTLTNLITEVRRLREVAYRKDMQVGKRDREIKRLQIRLIRAYDWVEKVVHGDDSMMADYTEYVCGGEEE
tara:strand:+ start:336 stop:593 length:258 start_codon:yes stop_codon:yes gene_type:complete